jgi:hypothetical protein
MAKKKESFGWDDVKIIVGVFVAFVLLFLVIGSATALSAIAHDKTLNAFGYNVVSSN